MPEQVLPGE